MIISNYNKDPLSLACIEESPKILIKYLPNSTLAIFHINCHHSDSCSHFFFVSSAELWHVLFQKAVKVGLNVTSLFRPRFGSRKSNTYRIQDHIWKRPELDSKMSDSMWFVLFTLVLVQKQIQITFQWKKLIHVTFNRSVNLAKHQIFLAETLETISQKCDK